MAIARDHERTGEDSTGDDRMDGDSGGSPESGTGLPPSLRTTVRRPVGWVAWLAHLGFVAAFLFGLDLPPKWQYVPLAASVLAFGLPHGAVDWVALPRAIEGRVTARWVAVVCGLYCLLGGAYLALWFLAPVAAAVAFIGLTWFHWGQGELYPLVAVFGGDHLSSRPMRALTVLVRGGLPMLVPLIAFPQQYRRVLGAIAGTFGGDVAAWPFQPTVRLWLAAAFGTVTLLTLALGYREATDRNAWAIDAGETGLLWAFFLVVPPVLAIGVYFCLWHSVRHVARVALFDGDAAGGLASGRYGPALVGFARDAALPTAGALVLCGALWVVAPDPAATTEGIVALYLVAIAVLTLPHVAVVTWLDRQQGLL